MPYRAFKIEKVLENELVSGAPLFLTVPGLGQPTERLHRIALGLCPDFHVVSAKVQLTPSHSSSVAHADNVKFAEFIRAKRDELGEVPIYAMGYGTGASSLIHLMLEFPEVCPNLILLHPSLTVESWRFPPLNGVRLLLTTGTGDVAAPEPTLRRFTEKAKMAGADTTLKTSSGGPSIGEGELAAIREFLR